MNDTSQELKWKYFKFSIIMKFIYCFTLFFRLWRREEKEETEKKRERKHKR